MSLLQEISKKFQIPNAYDKWTEYRDNLTDFVIQKIHKVKEQTNQETLSLLILGAGSCNDIDLSRIAANGVQITLLDIEKSGMEEACGKYNVNASCVEESITGITGQDLDILAGELLGYLRQEYQSNKLTKEALLEKMQDDLSALLFARETEEEFINRLMHCFGDGEYDMILGAGVLSQLYAQPLYLVETIKKNAEEQIFQEEIDPEKTLHKIVREANEKWIPIIVKEMLGASRCVGIFASEENKISPVEGAKQCLEMIQDYCSESKIEVDECLLSWPFDLANNRSYMMRVQAVFV